MPPYSEIRIPYSCETFVKLLPYLTAPPQTFFIAASVTGGTSMVGMNW